MSERPTKPYRICPTRIIEEALSLLRESVEQNCGCISDLEDPSWYCIQDLEDLVKASGSLPSNVSVPGKVTYADHP